MTKTRLTIRDIAKLAGVAPSTVSEVINGNRKKRVRSQTEAMIREVIEKHNYVSLPAARALSTQKTRHIGFLVSSTATLGIANAFFAETLAGVEEICTARNYRCVIGKYDFSPAVHNFVLSPELRQRSVDALIVTGWISEKCQQDLASLNIPVLLLTSTEVREPLFALHWESAATHASALEYLYSLGHRNILLPYYSEIEQQELERGIKCCRTTENFQTSLVHYTQNSFIAGKFFAQKVFASGEMEHVTALYADDQICCGFLQAMYQLGKNCPQDFSIFAHNDTAPCEWNTIPISANKRISFESGKLAANSIIDLLENIKTESETRKILSTSIGTSEVIKRLSCGNAPKK
ncbi:MAG: LacI family DNA-binding transcriptional regulator [Lentisphaeria bacterium]|nr:LacI family DNA-binding transcriptional regulator [Lentisphaeria bacterium]